MNHKNEKFANAVLVNVPINHPTSNNPLVVPMLIYMLGNLDLD